MITTSNKSFDPHGFFSLAGSLVRNANANDAELRTAINRAYYAVFLTARDALFGLDEAYCTASVRKKIDNTYRIKYGLPSKPRLPSHQRVIFSVKDKGNITLSQQMDQLREARVRADYKLDDTCLSEVGKQSWREYADETMQLASLILPFAKNLPSY